MPPPRAVILDLGNVLAFHDNELLFRNFAAMSGKDAGALARAFSGPLAVRVNRGEVAGEALRAEVARLLGVELPMDRFVELWSSHFTVHEEVLPEVEGLVGRVKLALLSNTNALHFEHLRARLPILERFEALFLSHELGLVKPEPGLYAHAVRALGVEPQEAVFFDDLPPYVEAARAAGLRARVFTDARNFRSDLAAQGL